jgi:PAS domain S-box-containing protein
MKDYTAPPDIHACLTSGSNAHTTQSAPTVDPLLLDVLPGAFLLVSPGTLEVRAASRAYCRLTGLAAAQVVGLPLLDLPTPHISERAAALLWQDTLLQSITRMLATGQPDAMPELRVRRTGSHDMLLAAMNVPVLRDDGSVRCIVHRVEDVSGIVRKHDIHRAGCAELDHGDHEQAFDVLVELADRTRALERANRRLQATQTLIQRTVDSAAIGVLMLDPAHRVVLQNAAARLLLHATRSDLMEASLLDLVHGSDRADLEQALATDALAAGEHQWLELRPSWSHDGEQWLRLSIAAADRDEDGAHRLVLLEDITASRRQQQQSRQQDTLLRIGGRMARVGGWAVDFRRNHVEWSREVAEVLEYPQTGAPPLDDALSRTPAEWRPLLDEQLARAATEGTPFDFELETITYAGRRIWIRVVGEPERDESGAIVRLVGALQDISEIKALQQSATVNSRRLESTLETMGDAFYILDRDWRFLYLNQEAEQLLQRSRDLLLGEPLWDAFPATRHTVIWDAFHRAMRDRVSTSFEINYPQLGHWFQARAHPTDEGIAVYFQTIDDRKQAEIAARTHAERFELVATASEAGIWDWQITQNTLHCSPRLKELLGGDPLSDLRSFRAFRALVHPDDQSAFDAALHSHLEHLSVFNVECRIRCRDEVTRWFNVAGRAARDMSGRPLRMVGSVVDITRRRAAEQEARDLARRLTLTLESVTDAVFTLDRTWRFGYLNSRAAALLERRASDLVGKVVWEEFPVAVDSIFETEYRRAMADGVPAMFEAHYPAPINKWFHVNVYPSEEGLVVYFRDVTDSHQATRALKASEERFRLLSKATNDAIWDWDLVTNALWWNEGYETLFGRGRHEVDASIDSWTAYIHPEDLDRTVGEINEVIDGGGDHWAGQYRYLRADGSYAWVLDRGYVIRDAEGVPMRMIGGMTDLTDRVMAEEQVAEQAALIDEASDAILVRDLSHRITFWNEGAKKVYGWSADEAVGRHATQ